MKIKVNNDILVWARQELNITQEEVADRMGRNIEDIVNWEEGKDYPTYAQLEKLAYTIYKRPLAVFFFPNIPNIPKNNGKFRTLDNEIFNEIPTRIIELMNQARVMQLNLQELDSNSRIRITELELDIHEQNFYEKLRDVLGVDIELQKKAKNMSDAFEMWRSAFYECGVYVFKEAFKDNSFSGFCLYDIKYPVIYINNSMSYSRQIFTLFHELCHILIKTSGIDKADDDYISRLELDNRKLEMICNMFAGKFLVPTNDLLKLIDNVEINEKNIEKLSKKYSVSRDVILRKLLDIGKISKEAYEKKHSDYQDEMYRKPINNGGGNYYNTKKAYLGENYINDVCSNYYSGKIDLYETANYLNVRVEAIPQLGVMIKEGSR
jgi:Zn-dependent peptidase ImmA (M78 family)/DNA-binding XRE family transcriptional regulator